MTISNLPQRLPTTPASKTYGDSSSGLVRRVVTAGKDGLAALDPRTLSLHRSNLRQLIGGACVTAASSYVFAKPIAEPLIKYAMETSGTANLYQMIPWGGSLINAMLGQAGAMSAIAVAAPLLGLVTTLVQSDGAKTDRFHWAMTHMAMGLAMSPIWILPAASAMGALPALGLSAACMVGVSLILGERIINRQASVRMLLVGVTLVCAGTPLPALMATGVATAHAVHYGTLVLAGGAAMLAGYIMNVSFGALKDDSTAELRALAVSSDLTTQKLNLPGESAPNVFCHNQALLDHAQYLRQQLDKGRKMDIQTMLLSGPPGTGKTAISRAIGNALSARTYLIKPSLILGAANPAQKIRELFDQAITLGGRAVFVFDDSEALFPNRKATGTFDTGFDTRTLLTTTLNDCIDGIEKNRYELLLVVISTNNRAYLDDSIRQRFATCDVDILPPNRAQAETLLRSLYTVALEKYLGRPMVDAFGRPSTGSAALPDSVVDMVLNTTFPRSWRGQEIEGPKMAGREYAALCSMALRHVSVHSHGGRERVPSSYELSAAFASELPRLYDQLNQRHLDAQQPVVMGA